jgi:ABC-2 type transport system ATP-binding protein
MLLSGWVARQRGKMQTHSVLLDVRGLIYSYGTRRAVAGIDLQVMRGECLGLLGPNGAGKTTVISCIAGLLASWQGEMSFNGHPFRPAKTRSDRACLGLVPQELAIYPHLSPAENLRYFAELCQVSAKDRTAAVERSLELAGLQDRRRDLVRTFSGGMQRRLNLAAGLVHRPELVLLDEPTVGVDPQSRHHIFETLQRLKLQGHSLLYTTHYMEEAMRLCDRIAIMHEGRIIACGTMDELAAGADAAGEDLESIFLKLTGRKLRDDY